MATPPSRCKGGETPRTPLGNLASSPNVPQTPATDGALDSPYFASGEDGSPGWILNDGTPGLSDSVVSEHANHLVEALMREPTDEDVRQELLSALKARRENGALRDHIEHLKNGEVDQGLEASKRMAQMSAEYMARVDEITRERDASRARAEAAEEQARELAAYMRSNGFGTPLARRPDASAADHAADADDAPRVFEGEGDISIGGDGVSASPSAAMETATPAANLFASPLLVNDPLDCIGTPGPNGASGDCADASFDFGGVETAPSTATVFPGDRRGSDAASCGSMDDESLRAEASEVARSVETPEATPRISNNGSTGVFVAPTPSGAGAEGAARVAMASMDHPTLVNEASNLVAANVRLERERRALVERLEKLQRTRPPSTPAISRPPPPTPSADAAAPFPSVATPGVFLTPGGGAAPAAETPARRGAAAGESPAASSSPRGVPSWDMLGTSCAAAQMSEALDRVKAAADEAAALLDPDRENGAEGAGAPAGGGGGGGGGTPMGHPGGTLDRALRRMRAHGHKVGGDADEDDRRRRAHALAVEVAQAASLASMQRDRLLEVMEVERRQARKEATDAFAAMGRALERTRGERSFVGSSPASHKTVEVTVSDVIVTPPAPEEPDALARAVERAETAERELAEARRAAAAAAAKAEERHVELQYESAARERDAARLAAELEAATIAAEAAQDVAERRQRQAASLEAKHTRLSMELSAALQKLRETERDVLAENRRLSLSFRANHQHVGGVISASPLVRVGGAMDVVGTPPDLAPINVGTPSSDSDASAASPVLSALARRVSATREGLAAALAAAEAPELEREEAADETAALVRELRAQLESSRADAAEARDAVAATEARAEEAERRAAEASAAAAAAAAKALVAVASSPSPTPPSPSPSPIARKSNRADVSALLDDDALERAAGHLGMDDDDDANAAALTWARRAEAAAREEAEEARNAAAAARAEAASASTSLETARGELERLRRDFASESAERERLGARVEELQEREAGLRMSLEETEQELRASRERREDEERDRGESRSVSAKDAEEALRAETTRLAASLAEANARADRSRDDVERAKAAMREWKDQQSAAVAKWMEESSARVRAAEEALAAANASAETSSREDPSSASASALLAENRELIAEAERQATQVEALEIRVAELVTRAEAAESAAADAPHLRSENYDLAVKHREGLRRLQVELAARRQLEDRVVEYEGAVKALEATVRQLEGALAESLEMCASARTASAAAAAAERARATTTTPTPANAPKTPADDAGSCDGSSSSPAPDADVAAALAAALAAKESMSAALEAAERAAAASREETTRANAAAAAAELEAEAARAVAESRRADLAVLRDECNALRWKVVDMEEDARVSPSPRHGGPPPRPLPGDSPFASMKSFSRLAGNAAADADAFDLAEGFVDPDATMMTVVTPERSPAPVPAAGGDLGGAAVASRIMSLTPPSSASPSSAPAAPPPSDADDEDERASFKAVASLALLAATLRSKADVLLTASSGSSEASGSDAGSPGTSSAGEEAATGAGAESKSAPLARSVSDLIQTETWLDQAISAAEGLRSENADLKRRVEETAAEARIAVADAAAARDEATAASSRADDAERRADAADRRAAELESELENSAKRVRALVEARATEDLAARESSAFAARSAEAEARARAEEAMAAKAKVRELQAGRRALEDAAAEASAARAAAECEAARARNEASEARAEATRESAAAEAAHDARRRAEETASRLAEAAAAAAAEAAASSPSPPPLIYKSPPKARAPTTEEAGTCTTPLALPAPAGPLAASPLAPAGGEGKFAEALRAYTKRLRDDVTKAEAEVAAHREHAEKMRAEIARLASDLPSERCKALRLATPSRDGDVDAATAENTAMNVAATGGKAEARAVYYKTIAKKCYQRMKQQKSAYEMQIDGLRRQIEFAGMGSLNLTNASFASTAATPSRTKTPSGNGNGNGNGVTFADDLPDLGSPDVDDVNLRFGGFLE